MSLTTMGWDLVYAIGFSRINDILAASGKIPEGFEGNDGNQSGYYANGTWGSWKLVTGSPSNLLWMKCVVASGTLTLPTNETLDISDSEWVVQFGLQLQPSNQAGTAGQNMNTLLPISSGNYSPQLISSKCNTVNGTASYALTEIMDNAISSQLLALGDVFGCVMLNTGSDWQSPTSAAFACEALDANDPNIGVFAILAMTEGRASDKKQVVVDRRILDGAPEGTEGALFIGPSLVMSQYFRPAIQSLVQQSVPEDFVLDSSTGTILYNQNAMQLGAFTYEEDENTTYTVYPNIQKGSVQMALDGDTLHLSLSNVNFPYPGWAGPGEITVSFDVQQYINFKFILREDGGLVMTPDTDNIKTSCNITVIPDEKEQIFQIALSAVTEVLMAVVGGAITSCASEAVEEGTTALADGGFGAEFGDIELQEFASEAGEDAVQETEEEAAEQAGDAIAHADDTGYFQKFKNLIVSYKWEIITKIIEKMVTIPVGEISNIALCIAQDEYDKAPAINAVGETCFENVKWADRLSFKVSGGAFDCGIVFYGKFE